MGNQKITTLFCDVGGVLMTNGWDRHIRAKAAAHFGLDAKDLDERHQLCFYLYEIGKISLKEYLDEIVFYQPRSFTLEDFQNFMYAQAEPFTDMIDFVKGLKREHQLKVLLLSNEGRELTERRIKQFHLNELGDIFFVSCFVHLRKPDREMYRMALDLVQVPPEQILYLEDRQLFIEVAAKFGIRGIKHTDIETTRKAVNELFK